MICKQMLQDKLLHPQELLWACQNPQETGAGNACVIAQDLSMTESAQRAVPTQPAGCHSDSDRYLENALLSCQSCVQECPTALWSSLQPTSKVWGLQLHSYLDSFWLSTLSSTIVTTAPLLHTDLSWKTSVRAKLGTLLVQAIVHSAHPNKPGLTSESSAYEVPYVGSI